MSLKVLDLDSGWPEFTVRFYHSITMRIGISYRTCRFLFNKIFGYCRMGHHADVQKSITATLELIILSSLSFGFPSLSVRLLTACDLIFSMAALVHIFLTDAACIIGSNLLVGRMLRHCHEAFLKLIFH